MTAARLGILPFFWIACIVIYYWGKRYFSPRIGLLAVFLFTFVPTVLAHSGLATTDVALTACLGLAFLRGAIWVEDPSWRNSVWLGVAGGLLLLSKHSGLLFFPSVALGAMLYLAIVNRNSISWLEEVKKRLPKLAPIAIVAFLIVWAGFRFSFGSVEGVPFPIPAPEFIKGIQEVRAHNDSGHPGYLLGEIRNTAGWWYFFEIALLVKTPVGFLLLAGLGCVLAIRRQGLFGNAWMPLCFSGSILLVSTFSRINIGLRHVLPVYLGFSILGALALHWLLNQTVRWGPVTGAVAVLWLAASSLIAHPDYLAYFNEFAGSPPRGHPGGFGLGLGTGHETPLQKAAGIGRNRRSRSIHSWSRTFMASMAFQKSSN